MPSGSIVRGPQSVTCAPSAVSAYTFDLDAFAEDVALFGALGRPYVALRDLLRQVEDTRIAVGAEAMEAARAVYHHAKGYPDSDALTEAREGLRVRFRARPSSSDDPPDAPTP